MTPAQQLALLTEQEAADTLNDKGAEMLATLRLRHPLTTHHERTPA